MQRKLGSALNIYWRSGVVVGLVFLDLTILIVCAIDILRFSSNGQSFIKAVQITAQIARHDHSPILLAIAVFSFFVIGMPVATACVAVFRPSENWPKWVGSKGVSVLMMHVLFSFAIACFSATAETMEVLSGWSKPVEDVGSTLEYNFTSFWLLAVFWCKFFSIAYLSPIIKKLFWRAAADRHGQASVHGLALETVKEVITEHDIHEH